ncbi:MAG: transcription-repair coupling factor [bacterium]|nr:transcription-repair coupling factor [bacterium]
MSETAEQTRDEVESGLVVEASELPPPGELTIAAKSLRPGKPLSFGNLWGSSQALVLAALASTKKLAETPWIVVTSTEGEAEGFLYDLAAFGLEATAFPARESYSSRAQQKGGVHADAAAVRARLQVAQKLASPPEERPRVLVGSILAFLQPVPAVRDLEAEFLTLRVGEMLDAEKLLGRLVKARYERVPLAEAPGEISLRGDILDVFPFASAVPVRIELFEDEIESVRTFDPTDQRSLESMNELEVCLASDAGAIGHHGREGEGVLVHELLAPGTIVCQIEPLRVEEAAETLRIQSPGHERALRTHHRIVGERAQLCLQSLPGDDLSLDTRSIQALQVGLKRAPRELTSLAIGGERVIVLCQSEGEERRFREHLDGAKSAQGIGVVETRVANLSKGFRCPPWNLVIVSHHELRGTLGVRRRAAKRETHKVRAIHSFFELKSGDLVVHAVHGLARFRGLERMERSGGEEEHLHLLFADDVSLYVPASRIDMVQRYIGHGASGLALDRIGGTTFRKRKEKVQRGLFDLASDLIDIQAKRALHERTPWDGDATLVRDMVESFPYDDTPDQEQVDGEIAADVGGPRPMDRMICGDVGFGKTELAVRAAFRVVAGGGQVAVLVPTTVLAKQHFETFSERLAEFPVEVRVVSRYVSPKDVRAALTGAASGGVDILIGTHRILSKDVHFKRLGLVVIDEEQRFGVQHKEHFKKLRHSVDILTMTATPIPRTLHMSLSGIRDISALTVPPPGRQEVETVLGYSDDEELIREALLREKNRGGQVFFLHNRVASIEAVAQRLRELVPTCSYAIGHGQMSAKELAEVMETFTSGDVDVLVATTIIENGLDIPTANTILIDDADHFGLSELHQLRGRVGRGSHKAFCYMLVERHKPLREIARERLKALEEMNHLGAGFGISVKDLELRGAGNVLGAEQSGHIAAVGYDMFCRLLRLTVERITAGEVFDKDAPRLEETEAGVELELGLRAFLPKEWIPDTDARIELLRRLATIENDEDARLAGEELRDRFGRVPPEAEALLRQFRLKARLDRFQLTRLAWRDGAYLIQYHDRVGFERLFAGLDLDLRRIKSGVAHLVVPNEHVGPAEALDWFEALVEPNVALAQ